MQYFFLFAEVRRDAIYKNGEKLINLKQTARFRHLAWVLASRMPYNAKKELAMRYYKTTQKGIVKPAL